MNGLGVVLFKKEVICKSIRFTPGGLGLQAGDGSIRVYHCSKLRIFVNLTIGNSNFFLSVHVLF